MRLHRRALLLHFILLAAIVSGCIDFAQHRVHHARGKAVAGLLGQLHAFVNGRMRRNPVKIEQLKRAQPQRNSYLGVQLGIGLVQQFLDACIQQRLPAQHAQHQSRDQIAIRR